MHGSVLYKRERDEWFFSFHCVTTALYLTFSTELSFHSVCGEEAYRDDGEEKMATLS